MGLLRFLRLGILEEKEEINPLPIVRRTARVGMNKNFRVGVVKHVAKDLEKVLIGVIEMSNCDDGAEVKEDTYNLWLHFNPEWKRVVSKRLVGKHVVFGFYMQSFRDVDASDKYDTILSCRFFNELPDAQTARSLAIDLMESQLFVDHYYLRLSNVKLNYTQNG